MLKRHSVSTEYGGERSILFAFQSLKNMLRLFFYHLRRSTRGSSERQQNLSSSLFRVSVDDDLRAFNFFSSTFCTADVASDDKSSNRRVTGSRVYIIRIFDFWDQLNISGGRAAIVFITMLIFLQRLCTAEARLTARHASN